jgi:hypothetical protein
MIEDTGQLVQRLALLRMKLQEAERKGEDAELARRLAEHVERTLERLRRAG